MDEYRKTIDLDRDKSYTIVSLGPIPGLPSWHMQAQPTSYVYPTESAAFRFAEDTKATYPGREVVVETPDGKRFTL